MQKILEKLANLINVKSIVTIILVVIFAVLSLKNTVSSEQFVSIFTMIISFYFGTQFEKNSEASKNGGAEK